MRYFQWVGLVFCSMLSCVAFGMPINSYFQQGVIIHNQSSKPILIADEGFQLFGDYPLEPGFRTQITFGSDRFTIASGQTFSRTINIISAADHSLVCTMTSHLNIKLDGLSARAPTSSDPLKCDGSTFQLLDNTGAIYGFDVVVRS